MWQKLSYSRKCLALLLAFVAFLLAAYQLSFSKTMQMRRELAEKAHKLAWLREKEKEIPYLQAKMALIKKVYAANDSTSLRDKLTAFISDYAVNNNCTVTEIPGSRTYNGDKLTVETNIFTVKGSFNPLLLLADTVEDKFRVLAKIMSMRFYTVRDLQTRRKNLYATLITQSFNQKSNLKK